MLHNLKIACVVSEFRECATQSRDCAISQIARNIYTGIHRHTQALVLHVAACTHECTNIPAPNIALLDVDYFTHSHCLECVPSVLAHEWDPEDRGVHCGPDRRGETGGICSQDTQCGRGQGTYP